MRRLIVTADDFGLTPGVCCGIRRAYEDGIVTSTSALVLAPSFVGNAGWLVDSGIDVGLHLALVGEDPPLLSAREIPSILDARGRLATSWRVFVPWVLRGRVDPDDVRREWEAQLGMLSATGVVVSHFDGHQHLHQLPSLRTALIELARDFGVRGVRLTSVGGGSARARALRFVADRSRLELAAAGLSSPDAFSGIDRAGRRGSAELVAEISRLGLAGVKFAELSTHPGEAHDPDRKRYRWGYSWERELEALCDPAVRAAVESNDFTLATFAELVASDQSSGDRSTFNDQ